MSFSASYRRIFAIAVPVVLANLLLPLQGLIDTAVLGHFPDAAYLSALGLASSLFGLLYSSFNFLQYATSGLSAQALGAGRYAQLQCIAWRGLISALLIAALLIVLRPLLIRIAEAWFAAAADTERLMGAYIRIRLWGACAELGLYCSIGWFAGQGLGKYIFWQQAVLTLGNVSLSLFFVYVIGLGIYGVAFGTVIASYLALAVALFLITRRERHFGQVFFRPDWARVFRLSEIRRLLALNRDLFLRTLLLAFCLAWFSRLASQLGDRYLAANVLLLWLLTIASYALDGIAVAAESLTGQAIGGGNAGGFRLVVKRTLGAGFLLALGLGGCYALFMVPYLNLMTSLDSVRETAWQFHLWAVFLPLAGVLGYLFDGYYFGAARADKLRNAMFFVAAIVIPGSWLLTARLGNAGVWIGIYAFLLLRVVFLFPGVSRLAPSPDKS